MVSEMRNRAEDERGATNPSGLCLLFSLLLFGSFLRTTILTIYNTAVYISQGTNQCERGTVINVCPPSYNGITLLAC